MADIGDVCAALVNLVATALYPSGVGSGSPLGVNFRIYRGHPGPDVLDADIRAGFTMSGGGWSLSSPASRIVHVCINPRNGVGRTVKPYVFQPVSYAALPPATLTVSLSGSTVTIGGTIAAGQGVAISVAGISAGAAAGSTDTLATLASSVVAALISAGATASASGAVVTVSGAPLYANTFVQVATAQEVKRQIQGFDITLYVPGRDLRDTVSSAISSYLASQDRFTLPDGFQARLMPSPPIELDDDRPEKALLFMRRIFYSVEYATVLSWTAATQALSQANMQTFNGSALATVVEA